MSVVLSALPTGTFGEALQALKLGKCVARKAWIHDINKAERTAIPWITLQNPAEPASILTRPFFYKTTTDAVRVWEPKTEDVLADDWILIRHPFDERSAKKAS